MRYSYRGYGERVYSSRLHPETGTVLVVRPGDEVEFDDQSPPDDGQWYDCGDPPDYEDDSTAGDPGTADDGPGQQED